MFSCEKGISIIEEHLRTTASDIRVTAAKGWLIWWGFLIMFPQIEEQAMFLQQITPALRLPLEKLSRTDKVLRNFYEPSIPKWNFLIAVILDLPILIFSQSEVSILKNALREKFFWSVFSSIRIRKNSVFGHFSGSGAEWNEAFVYLFK